MLRRIRRTIPLALCAACFLALQSPAHAGWRTFTTRDGLPTNSIRCVMEDRAGNLWFGASNASLAIRYDGSTWHSFPVPDNSPSPYINCMFEDSQGNLWFGTSNTGVKRFDGTNWTSYLDEIVPGQPGTWVNDIAEDQWGTIWFATNEGIHCVNGSFWRTYTVTDGLYYNDVKCIEVDRHGEVWAGTTLGVNRFDGTFWYRNIDVGTSAMLVDHSGKLWIGGRNASGQGCVGVFDGSSPWRIFTEADGLASDYIYSIAEDYSGKLWFGTDDGLSRYDGSKWRTYTKADGMVSNFSFGVLGDRSGNLWVLPLFSGVSRYDQSGWRTFTTGDGLRASWMIDVIQASNDDIWVIPDGGGAARYNGLGWKSYGKNEGAPSDTIYGLTEDAAGNMWFAHAHRGASRFDGTNWRLFTPEDGLGSSDVGRVFPDRDGNMWVTHYFSSTILSRYDGVDWRVYRYPEIGGGYNCHLLDRAGHLWIGHNKGAARFDGSTWHNFLAADGLTRVLNIYEDRNGILWFGRVDGVSRFDGANWQHFNTSDGFLGQWVSAIQQDRAGNLWFGTETGATRFDGSTWHTFTTEDGLGGNYVWGILEDDVGNLWFMAEGVTRYDGSTWRTFTAVDGLANNQANCWTRDREGNLWFGTPEGLSRYEPDRVAPQTIFRSVPSGLLGSRTASARFAAFAEPEGIEFSFRLDGGPWSAWSSFSDWTASGLADGTHRLEARSRDFVANVDSTPAATTFFIDATPPLPVIASPSFGQAVRGTISVTGTASDARFASYRIDVRPTGAGSWNSPEATNLIESTSPVTDGTLASWNTTAFPDGQYELRLMVTDSLGLSGTGLGTVIVDNQFPSAGETSPARVLSATGGDLYTIRQELHFYFPPRAFDEDVLVSIGAAAAPDTLPTGAVRVLPAYEVDWNGTPLRKPATLEFSTAGRTTAPGALSIYVSRDGASWQRLGGTLEKGKVSLAVRESGRYGLFAESAPIQGNSSLSALSFTPRVFSTSHDFANDQVAIGFTLGRSAPVTVRIYNRAGRLVREVASGQTMGAGGNLVRWDGRDRANVTVADGLYVVTVEALGQTQRNTIAVVK